MRPDSNRDSKGKSGWGFASMELADKIICTSTNHTNGETVRCAENNQQRGVKKRKKKMRDGIKGLELKAPSVFREAEKLFGCRQAQKVPQSTGCNYLG